MDSVLDGQKKLTKKQRAALRQQEGQHKAQSKNNKRTVLWALAVTAALAAVYGIVTLVEGNNAARPGESLVTMKSSRHIQTGQRFDKYNSNPPTSGPHSAPVRWGISPTELADENLVHNLEHGGIWISYKSLDQPSVTALRKIARQNPRSVVLSPRAANDVNIAVASWGKLLRLEAVDIDQINDFIAENINKSPERLAR